MLGLGWTWINRSERNINPCARALPNSLNPCTARSGQVESLIQLPYQLSLGRRFCKLDRGILVKFLKGEFGL
jgi:hypothetical protein